MRPPAEQQSALRKPLNYLLGTETAVRILRVLSTTATPIGKAELARQADLNASGVRRALKPLIELGIVDEVGNTPRQPVRLRESGALSQPLRRLFNEETARFEQIIDSLRLLVSRIDPPPLSAWIEGSVASGDDEPGDPLTLGVLATSKAAARTREQLLALLPEYVSLAEVHVVPKTRTRADFSVSEDPKAELGAIMLLIAPHPLQLLDSEQSIDMGLVDSHDVLDRGALALATELAERISKDPELVHRAVRRIRHQLETSPAPGSSDVQEWLSILEHKSVAQIRSLLTDPSERGRRLRQSLPFLDVLSETERSEILRRVNGDT